MVLRMSRLLLKTLRDDPADAETASHRLLVRAGYVRRSSAGVWSWLPLGKRVLDNVARIVREEMDAIGGQEVLLPALLPRQTYDTTGRAAEYGDLLFSLTDRKGAAYVLGPTHEEPFTLLVKDQVTSYRDLPVILYQIQTKYRDEARPRSGVLRGREFQMKDAYSFDLAPEGLAEAYRLHREAYVRIFRRLGLTVRIVSAVSGAMGGSTSEEFLAPAQAGEDTFADCPACGFAANVEAVARPADPPSADGPCPRCGAALRLDRAIEVGHIFQLGRKYSDAFGLDVPGPDGRPVRVTMGCYGIGVSRAVAALAEQTADAHGLCWPAEVAPADVHIVAAGKEAAAELAERAARSVEAAGLRVVLDDREAVAPGVKFTDAELIGVPRVLVAGRRAGEGVLEVRDRRTGARTELPLAQAVARLRDA